VKILLYADLDVSLPGGLETHLRELARALAARGHAVDVFGRSAPDPALRTVARVDADAYDVVHHHAGAWPAGLDVGERYVRTHHFCVAAKMDAYVRRGRLRTLVNPGNWKARQEERAAARRPGRHIAVSARVRDEFARFHGLDPSDVAVIPNGVRRATAREGRAAWRARHGIGGATPVLLTVGRRDFVKGHALLDRVWREVREGGLDALWVRVGDDASSREPGRWTTGPVPHAEVREWIEAADAGALPSLYEGCSVALLEMVAGGLYSLAHDVGNAREVLEPGRTGEIVAPDEDAWAAALLRILPERARNRARTPGLPAGYAWEDVAARVESVYRSGMTAGRAILT
jgi:glycosyltransferase involved in cell wall biosynthesis